ncbi:nucleocapsid protein [BtNv-AlphaCoV/SC2013]|uniref:Nucleoprotein n=1 Tax=BtNv-AlphaCoV/SC2013 TaxID=1503291 RepID=A0A0U1WHF5_9ALPC|nr:nucleocapsid protein [BtNv-AlphaCoV/SC2013]AIA62269.1 nucleocapsid protein [BtNv-AlphaCoV/SC2013]
MSSSKGNVGFDNAARGRSGRVPFSFYMPVINNSSQPFYKVMPQNAVPKGQGNKDQQIGYWNEQVRWRMVKGTRKDLPSKWHFYYLGTGPHADLKFRQRQQGVFWVAKEGAKAEPTGLGTRGRNAELTTPIFNPGLPDSIEIVDQYSRPNSRASSRARSQSNDQGNRSRSQSNNRAQSNNRSQSRGRQNQNQNNQPTGDGGSNGQRNQPRNRSNSRNRSGNQGRNGGSQQDLVAAVREALAGMGFKPNTSGSGRNTPVKVPKGDKPLNKPTKAPASQVEKPVWKRTPHSQENVEVCFGPRDTYQNFGDSQLVRLGVDYPHYPQIGELIPSQAALLFGSEITAHERGDNIQLTYIYKMEVPKDHKSLAAFLPHIGAYADSTEDVTLPPALPPKQQRLRRSASTEVLADTTSVVDEEEVEEVVDDVTGQDETFA